MHLTVVVDVMWTGTGPLAHQVRRRWRRYTGGIRVLVALVGDL